jgi:quercetin 2,3-dioxygenase
LQTVTWLLNGDVLHRDIVLRPGRLLYLGPGRDHVTVAAPAGSRVFLLGGVPVGERLLRWWNLVARAPGEIEAAVTGWREGRFGTVAGHDGPAADRPAGSRL